MRKRLRKQRARGSVHDDRELQVIEEVEWKRLRRGEGVEGEPRGKTRRKRGNFSMRRLFLSSRGGEVREGFLIQSD